MNLLVGVPVFRVVDLTRKCLISLLEFPAEVLVVDNNADPDIKLLLNNELANKVHIIHNEENMYCNGGWNQILQYGIERGYDVVGLGSSDVILHPGWYNAIRERAKHPKEVWLPRVGDGPTKFDYEDVEEVRGGLAGFFTFMPIEAAKIVYPIPSTIRHWFGDQYMFEKLRREGWNTVIINDMRAYHQQSAITLRVPEAYNVIEQDKVAWEKL